LVFAFFGEIIGQAGRESRGRGGKSEKAKGKRQKGTGSQIKTFWGLRFATRGRQNDPAL